MKEPCVFLSYVHADQPWAEQFSSLRAGSGITICNSWSSLKPGEDFEARLSRLRLESVNSFMLVAGSLSEVISGPTDTSRKL